MSRHRPRGDADLRRGRPAAADAVLGLLLLQAQNRLGQAANLLLPAAMLLVLVASLVLLGQALQRGARDRAVL